MQPDVWAQLEALPESPTVLAEVDTSPIDLGHNVAKYLWWADARRPFWRTPAILVSAFARRAPKDYRGTLKIDPEDIGRRPDRPGYCGRPWRLSPSSLGVVESPVSGVSPTRLRPVPGFAETGDNYQQLPIQRPKSERALIN